MDTNTSAAGAAAILNACWWVRHHCRPTGADQVRRRAKLRELAAVVMRELQAAQDPEPVLYALASGLYDRRDARFQV